MSAREEFLAIKSYDEYNKRRDEFNGLDWTDTELSRHWCEIMPKPTEKYQNGIIEEAFHTKPPR